MSNNIARTSITQLLSVMLVLGGLVGIGIAVMLIPQAINAGPLAAAHVAVLLGSVFAWSVWQGVNLWRGKTEAIRWAKILFLSQIPAFSFAGFGFEFYTLLNFSVQFGQVQSPTAFNLGSSLSALYIGPNQPDFIGFNLIAIAASAYLLFRFRPNKLLEPTR